MIAIDSNMFDYQERPIPVIKNKNVVAEEVMTMMSSARR